MENKKENRKLLSYLDFQQSFKKNTKEIKTNPNEEKSKMSIYADLGISEPEFREFVKKWRKTNNL